MSHYPSLDNNFFSNWLPPCHCLDIAMSMYKRIKIWKRKALTHPTVRRCDGALNTLKRPDCLSLEGIRYHRWAIYASCIRYQRSVQRNAKVLRWQQAKWPCWCWFVTWQRKGARCNMKLVPAIAFITLTVFCNRLTTLWRKKISSSSSSAGCSLIL